MDIQEKVKKRNAFMGTIAVSIVYAIVALILLLLGYFTEFGKRSILGSLSTFTTTFIIGTVLVITFMTFLVVSWEPEEASKSSSDSNRGVAVNASSCPDYWTVEHDSNNGEVVAGLYRVTEANENDGEEVIQFGDTPINTADNAKFKEMINNLPKSKFSKVCRRDDAIVVGKETPVGVDNKDNAFRFLVKEDSEGASIDCSKVYPEYLGYLDAMEYANNNYTGNPNRLRCEYAKVCGVPWTEVGCE